MSSTNIYFANSGKTLRGTTIYLETPKLSSTIHGLYLRDKGIRYDIVNNGDGTYTVNGDGLEPVTFAKDGGQA